ncbi:uncharacterized protein CTRU02_213369 [Colletotrichum truncatum]|uniref:Uncharacterized protein n=1 Tax=Colletotrichum truncatum TaxID=5467 RepID=A0ACC3YKI5_COLTU|nr:uncharacterized protein CTRU02_13371 [Colletotrichum truncatum]KAF6783380.1 hypothetical protein CTRU02_13371 [Colletotrichum truncatum]
MFMNAPPRLGFHGSDIFAFEQRMTARAQEQFNNRRFRKLIARHKHPLSAHRSPQSPGSMASEDWSLANVPDGIQDSFEAQQLRNRYLAGTAGSPYSDPESYMIFQRLQQVDTSLHDTRPVMDHGQPWHPDGMLYTNDIQSMFAPMQFQFGVASMEGTPIAGPGYIGQNVLVSSPVFSATESGGSFGSFSSTGAPNPMDAGSFSSVDGIIDTSPSQQFEYTNSPFASSSLIMENMPNIKAPPSPLAFSEPTPIVFFQSPSAQLTEPPCHREDHHNTTRIPVLQSYNGDVKAEPPVHHPEVPKPRKGLPEKPRPRVNSNEVAQRCNSSAHKAAAPGSQKELRPKQTKPCQQEVPIADITDQDRNLKDEYLLQAKAQGLTYREIRVKGNFTEAESTLRGRYRTLTKTKEERVRKPEWTDNDIQLLRRAVRKFSKGNDPASMKIPWKQVAEYIRSHDGSYLFGNATCRKKWDEIVQHSAGRHVDENTAS